MRLLSWKTLLLVYLRQNQLNYLKIAIPNQTTKSFNFKIADIALNSLSDISLFELIKKIEDFEKNNYYMQMINLSNTKILLLI